MRLPRSQYLFLAGLLGILTIGLVLWKWRETRRELGYRQRSHESSTLASSGSPVRDTTKTHDAGRAHTLKTGEDVRPFIRNALAELRGLPSYQSMREHVDRLVEIEELVARSADAEEEVLQQLRGDQNSLMRAVLANCLGRSLRTLVLAGLAEQFRVEQDSMTKWAILYALSLSKWSDAETEDERMDQWRDRLGRLAFSQGGDIFAAYGIEGRSMDLRGRGGDLSSCVSYYGRDVAQKEPLTREVLKFYLEEMTKATDQKLLVYGLEVVTRHHIKDDSVVDPLTEVYKSNPDLRLTVLSALEKSSPSEHQRNALFGLLRSSDNSEDDCRAVLATLGKAYPNDILGYVAQEYSSATSKRRETMFDALNNIDTSRQQAQTVAVMEKLASGTYQDFECDDSLRAKAFSWLVRQGHLRIASNFTRALEDRSEEIRLETMDMARISPDETRLSLLRQRLPLESDPDIRSHLQEVISHCEGVLHKQ